MTCIARSRRGAVLLAGAVACGAPSTESGSGGAIDGSGLASTSSGEHLMCNWSGGGCGLPNTCIGFGAGVVWTCGSSTYEFMGELQCVLQSLQGGVRGSLGIGVGGDTCGYVDEIWLLGDRTAVFIRSWQREDGLSSEDPPRRVRLREPAFFDACVAGQEDSAIRDCLMDWFDPDIPVDGECCPVPNDCGLPPC